MAAHLHMAWDIREETQAHYIEFVLSEWVPGMQRLGADLREAWYTQAGNGPEIHVVLEVRDQHVARQILEDAAFARLHQRLLGFVEGFRLSVRAP